MSLTYKYNGKEYDIETIGVGTPAAKDTFLLIADVNAEIDKLKRRIVVLSHSLDGLHTSLGKILDNEEGA